ncbi:retrovirus-related pol polyprotein from transposon TNT 1-94 [Tanacetum coccineum]
MAYKGKPRSKTPQSSGKDDYFPYVPTFDPLFTNNIIIPDPITPTDQVNNSPDESSEFSIADDHLDHHEPDDFEPPESHNNTSVSQVITLNDVFISEAKPSPTTISPSTKASVTTRSKIRDFKAVLAHEYLYVNFLSEIKPKKLVKALEEEGWIIAMQEELNQFERNKGVRQEEGIDYDETFAHVARLESIRIFLAYASYMDFMVYQMDMKSEFLNGKLSEKVYV